MSSLVESLFLLTLLYFALKKDMRYYSCKLCRFSLISFFYREDHLWSSFCSPQFISASQLLFLSLFRSFLGFWEEVSYFHSLLYSCLYLILCDMLFVWIVLLFSLVLLILLLSQHFMWAYLNELHCIKFSCGFILVDWFCLLCM